MNNKAAAVLEEGNAFNKFRQIICLFRTLLKTLSSLSLYCQLVSINMNLISLLLLSVWCCKSNIILVISMWFIP